MSDARKILVPKRGTNVRAHRTEEWGTPRNKQGIKRFVPPPNTPPSKNSANDRLKRLRTQLAEEVVQKQPNEAFKKASSEFVKRALPKKRPEGSIVSNVLPKIFKTCDQNSTAVLPQETKQEVTFSFSVFGLRPENKGGCGTVPRNTTQSHEIVAPCSAAPQSEEMEWSTVCNEVENRQAATETSPVIPNSNSFIIVVDTNILINSLETIKKIVSTETKSEKNPVIFIPWLVIEELDFIKDDTQKTALKHKAQQAVKFINQTLSDGNSRIKGQTFEEVNEQRDLGKSPDNKIIASCMQVLSKRKNMILVSSDINLRNKAIINNIPVCSESELMAKISSNPVQQVAKICSNPVQQSLISPKNDLVLNKMCSLCSQVINQCAKKAYGKASERMDLFRTKPRSFRECIRIFKKYWFPVFREYLLKQFKKAIDDLQSFLLQHKDVKDGSSELEDLVRLCVRVCLFLKDVDNCKGTVEDTIRQLNKIKES